MQLNIHEHEEVKGLRQEGLLCDHDFFGASIWPHPVIVAAGKLTFLQKLGPAVEYDPRVAYTLSESHQYSGKNILVHGATAASIDAALVLAEENTVTVLDHRQRNRGNIEAEFPVFHRAVQEGKITFIEHAELHELGEREARWFNTRDDGEKTFAMRTILCFLLPVLSKRWSITGKCRRRC